MSHYVEVDSARLELFLQGLGFTREVHCNEVVYTRRHNLEPRLQIKVYTSIATGESVARKCGADAIRVVAVLNGKDKVYPIFRGQRVFRTTSQESVQERVLERCRAAYARMNEWRKEQHAKNGSFNFGANQ